MRFRPLRFLPRAQITGRLRWVCSNCGYVSIGHMRPESLNIRYCAQCQAAVMFTLAQWIVLTGPGRELPPDRTIPALDGETMPDWADRAAMALQERSRRIRTVRDRRRGIDREAVEPERLVPEHIALAGLRDAMGLAPVLGPLHAGELQYLAGLLGLHCAGCGCDTIEDESGE
jgi:hypothetical protein